MAFFQYFSCFDKDLQSLRHTTVLVYPLAFLNAFTIHSHTFSDPFTLEPVVEIPIRLNISKFQTLFGGLWHTAALKIRTMRRGATFTEKTQTSWLM